MNIPQRIDALHWGIIADDLNHKGYACTPKVLLDPECNALIAQYDDPFIYRNTINMDRYRFGLGQYKYFSYPLPEIIQSLRESIYPKLVPVANSWMRELQADKNYPEKLNGLLELCHAGGQQKPTPLILRYGPGGHNTLHQDLYGQMYFPFQVILFLNEPELDYSGGEFVLVEQKSRAQSKAMVIKPGKGDMLIFTTKFRPVKGSKGYYRANIKHGVSELRAGARHTVGIIFHDAL